MAANPGVDVLFGNERAMQQYGGECVPAERVKAGGAPRRAAELQQRKEKADGETEKVGSTTRRVFGLERRGGLDDLGTKHHPKWRLQQLVDMMPVTIGVLLLKPRGADAEEINANVVMENTEGGSDMLQLNVLGFLFLLLLVVGYRLGLRTAEQRVDEAKEERWSEKYQYAKLKLHQHSAEELRQACGTVQFHCGAGATKEAMIRGLLCEHGFDLQSLVPAEGGLLGLLKASGGEVGIPHAGHVMRASTPASERRRSVRKSGDGADRRHG